MAGAGICHLQPVPRASLGELSPLNSGDVTAWARGTVPRATHGWAAPSHPALGPHPWWLRVPRVPLVPHVPMPVSPFPRRQFHFIAFPSKTPSYFGHLEGFFFQLSVGLVLFFGFFFHFFPFSQCFYHLGEKRNNSRCSAPAFPCRGGGPRGPRMLLVLCREFGATSAQGWHCPGPRGRRCRTGDSLMSWKVVLGSSPALPLSPKGDRSPASTNRSQQTRGSRWIPGLGSGRTAAAPRPLGRGL